MVRARARIPKVQNSFKSPSQASLANNKIRGLKEAAKAFSILEFWILEFNIRIRVTHNYKIALPKFQNQYFIP